MLVDTRRYRYFNRASSLLVGAIAADQTSITVADATQFPIPGPDEIVVLVCYTPSEAKYEVMYCTAVAGNVLTVERGKEDTAGLYWPDATPIYNWVTAGFWLKLITQPDALWFTSRPYPYEDIEEFNASGGPPQQFTYWELVLEEFGATGGMVSGTLRSQLQTYSNYPPEAFDISGYDLLSGTLLTLLKSADAGTEAFDVGPFDLLSGNLRDALITYSNYPTESLDVNGDFISGSLS